MIKRLRITRFKALREFVAEFEPFHVLVGANSSGKTSVLQAIHFATALAQSRKLYDLGSPNSFPIVPQRLLYSPVHDLDLPLLLSVQRDAPAEDATRIHIEMRGEAAEPRAATIELGIAPGGIARGAIAGGFAATIIEDINRPFSIYVPGLAGLARLETFVSFGMLLRAVARGDSNLVLRNVLHALKTRRPVQWQQFLNSISAIFPETSIDVQFDDSTDESIRVFVARSGFVVPFESSGTGFLQAVQILSYIYLFGPAVVLLDEPDSHLHPNNQRRLVKMLSDIADRGETQIIATTHSRHVMDAIRGRGSLMWISSGRRVEGVAEQTTQMLAEIGALDSLDYFVDGVRKCIVLTEDEDKVRVEEVLFSSGFVEAETLVVSYKGCAKVDTALIFGNFIRDRAPNIALVVHRDRDYMNDHEAARFESILAEIGVEAFITPGSDVEGAYLNAAHLVEMNEGLELETAERFINEVIAETRDDAIQKMVNLRVDAAQRTRNRGSGVQQINYGRIAQECAAAYDANPRQMARGTICIGRLTAKIQQRLRQNPVIFKRSTHLPAVRLSQIAAKVWPLVRR